jgi:hypothetical protein
MREDDEDKRRASYFFENSNSRVGDPQDSKIFGVEGSDSDALILL